MKTTVVNLARRLIRAYRIKLSIPYKIHQRQKKNLSHCEDFKFEQFKSNVLRYIEECQIEDESSHYLYSASVNKPTLYASVYACMTRGMLGSIHELPVTLKQKWCNYFDSFQSQEDGLFYDPAVENKIYAESDWWGARHLALHMISAYTALGAKPKHPFHFLNRYYSGSAISDWLGSYDWFGDNLGREDPDNKIMNVGCLLQYQRDTWDDKEAGAAVQHLKDSLRKKLNKETGMWGGFDVRNPHERSRMVQFAYHLFPIFFYDGEFDFDAEKIVGLTLATQNRFGGFGVLPYSSACEDIDSIDLLIRFYPYVSAQLQSEINDSLAKAFNWVLLNQVDDGGFVFRLWEPFVYGSDQMRSKSNEGALFPTWFRSLSIIYILAHFNKSFRAHITNCPGLVFI